MAFFTMQQAPSLEQKKMQAQTYIQTLEQLFTQQVTAAKTYLLFCQSEDTVDSILDGLNMQIRVMCQSLGRKTAEDLSSTKASTMSSHPTQSQMSTLSEEISEIDCKVKTETGTTSFTKRTDWCARMLRDGVNPAKLMPAGMVKKYTRAKIRNWEEKDIQKLHETCLRLDKQTKWLRSLDLIQAVAEEFADGVNTDKILRSRISQMCAYYTEGKPMLKGEVEFLNYYLNDLRPRIRRNFEESLKVQRKKHHEWKEEDIQEILAKFYEVSQSEKVYFKVSDFLEDVIAAFPKGHWLDNISKITSKIQRIEELEKMGRNLWESEKELVQFYRQVVLSRAKPYCMLRLMQTAKARIKTMELKTYKEATSNVFKIHRKSDSQLSSLSDEKPI